MDLISKKALRKFFKLDNMSFLVLSVLFVLMPLSFLTTTLISFQFYKFFLMISGVALATILFIVNLIKGGKFDFSFNPIFISFKALLLITFVSAIFGTSFLASTIGYGFEMGTVVALLILGTLIFLVVFSFDSPKKLFSVGIVFIFLSGLLATFYWVRFLFGVDILSFGVFNTLVSNTIGAWNEVAIFFATSLIVSLIALESLRFKRIYQIVLSIILVLSLGMVAVSSFIAIWYVIAFVTLAFFIYQTAIPSHHMGRMTIVGSTDKDSQETRMEPGRRKIALKTLIVGIVAFFFILPVGRDLTQGITTKLGIGNFEVRPSWSATYDVYRSTIKSAPLLGPGPNRFFTQWQLYRSNINQTEFWNVNFERGVGGVPTSMVETGILGSLGWLVFLGALLVVGLRSVFVKTSDQLSRYLTISSFLATFFLWAMNILYVPGVVVVFLTFFFTGVMIASAIQVGLIKVRTYNFTKNSTLNFVVTIVSVCLIVLVIGLVYVFFEHARSSFYFQKAIVAIQSEGDLDGGENMISRALRLAENDIYYRALTDTSLVRLNGLVAQVSDKVEATEAEKGQFQIYLSNAVQSALRARNRDPYNLENLINLAQVYQTLVPLRVTGAYEEGLSVYQDALRISPQNPFLLFSLARLEVANNNLKGAEEYIAQALTLKPNYLDPIFLQSQIDIARGNLSQALKTAEKAVVVAPDNANAYFRLGLLKYDTKNYSSAINSFEQAITLLPLYADAKYYLGLSYYNVGRRTDAITQFEGLKQANPDNQNIDSILSNLKARRDPFAGTAVDQVPENSSVATPENN